MQGAAATIRLSDAIRITPFFSYRKTDATIIISVPLIIEKIIKKNVLPKLQTPSMKVLLKLSIHNRRNSLRLVRPS